MRLQKILNKIISPDQVGYIKGRFIGISIRTTADILTYCQLNTKEKALISLIDFEKAFDSINWSFLLKSLQTFNFRNSLISWVKTLYTDIESCVTNNGKSSIFFKLERGIRQGCCLSALLFIIVAELLAISIRTNKLIHGVKIQQDEFKICQLADDTTLFLRDTCSLKIVLNLLDEFSVISGLKINKDKTEVFSVNHDSNLGNSLGISWRKNTFKALGVWFSLDENEMTKLNLENKLDEIKKIINCWSCRNLTLFGEVVILKTLVLSKIVNIFSVIYVPDNFIKEVDALFFEFLWGKGKRPKVKKEITINDKVRGGIKW